ncbi:hypothetical protein PIB30_077450 [Stylosanthes scabra]|uniref:Uncharacterized protein n=1 Tax=Stylosanthes scabra TaxID=79078 RepID=A0ABU6QRT2_9FABA|nr:hypothetical protein [Stylosanthes scabra]
MALELGRTPTQSEVFARTHTQKEDREWVDKRSSDVNDAYEAELKRLQDERQAAIDAGDPVPPHRRGRGVGTGSGRPQAGEGLWDRAGYPAQQGDFAIGGGACSELSCCRGRLCGEGADLGVHRADAVTGGLRLEESLFRHVQLPDSDAGWRIRLRFDARHASPTASTAAIASCSVIDSCSVTDACSVTDSPIAA